MAAIAARCSHCCAALGGENGSRRSRPMRRPSDRAQFHLPGQSFLPHAANYTSSHHPQRGEKRTLDRILTTKCCDQRRGVGDISATSARTQIRIEPIHSVRLFFSTFVHDHVNMVFSATHFDQRHTRLNLCGQDGRKQTTNVVSDSAPTAQLNSPRCITTRAPQCRDMQLLNNSESNPIVLQCCVLPGK